jgi:hypothetical protein
LGLATTLATVAVAFGWRGSDLPAQVFRAELFQREGFVLFNSQWFGGHATLAYSVLSPVLAALTGPVALGAVGGVVSAALFERIVRHGFGRSSLLGALWFSASTVTNLVVGRVTFAFGVALGLGAVLALQRRRVVVATFLAVACSLASPLAGLFLAIGAGACVLASPTRRAGALATAAGALAPIAAVTLLFPDPGSEPYAGWAFAVDLALCLAVWLFVPRDRAVLHWGAAIYAAVVVIAFVVPTALGGNVSRLDQYVAGPLLACAAVPNRRVFVAVIAIPLLIWQWYPTIDGIAYAHDDPSTRRAYYAPLIEYVESQPQTFGRVEIPSTYRHWEAAYAAPSLALARGWQRQLDIGYHPIFYEGPLNERTYRTWLADNGVEFVALPDVKLDASSLEERALLERGVPYLRAVWHDEHWRVWRFVEYRGLVRGPADLVDLEPDRFTLDVHHAGTISVRVRASSFWSIATDDFAACVEATPDGWTRVRARDSGRVEIDQSLTEPRCER